jgi:hypothetical protein
MARERYNPQDNKFVSYDKVNAKGVAEDIYAQVGAEFPLQWVDGEPVVDSNDLPDGVTMSDVRQAVKDNHPRA